MTLDHDVLDILNPTLRDAERVAQKGQDDSDHEHHHDKQQEIYTLADGKAPEHAPPLLCSIEDCSKPCTVNFCNDNAIKRQHKASGITTYVQEGTIGWPWLQHLKTQEVFSDMVCKNHEATCTGMWIIKAFQPNAVCSELLKLQAALSQGDSITH